MSSIVPCREEEETLHYSFLSCFLILKGKSLFRQDPVIDLMGWEGGCKGVLTENWGT